MSNKTYNKTIFIGRVNSMGALCDTNDKNTKKKIMFDLTNNSFNDGKEVVNHQTVVATNKTAETVAKHLNAGDLCCIEGVFDSKTKFIVAERVTFLSSRKGQQSET